MALERIGLGGLLTLDNKQFVQASGAARNELGQFIRTANQAPPALNMMRAPQATDRSNQAPPHREQLRG